MRIALYVALAALAAACGRDSSASGAEPRAADTAGALAATNDAVPAELRERLRFQAVTADDGRLAALAPAGWETGAIPDRWRPPDAADLGFMTSFAVGSNCDGACAAKDWPAVAEKVELAQLLTFEVVEDEPLGDAGRLVVARNGGSVHIAAAWWKPGASRYFFCRASLEDDAAAAADAFERACRSAQVLTW